MAEPDCRVTADAPHFSNGAGGVIAKSRFTCEYPRTTTFNEVLMNLYHCSQAPAGEERGWTTRYGCRVVKSAHYYNIAVGAGTTQTRYVPDRGEAGATNGGGYWAQCTQYVRDNGPKQRVPSIVRTGPLTQ
ncbi:MAG: hypothetical protein ACRDT0_19950 [Pseudonocardiaceae bacterium]